jgi:iron complex transport system substrate-binding protein
MPFIYIFFFLIFVTISCTSSTTDSPIVGTTLDSIATIIPLQYANNFSIEKDGDNTILSIKSAWKGSKEQYKYVLYPKGGKVPTNYSDAVKIAVPVERIICTSTVDIAFLDFLGVTDKIVAMANGGYVYNKYVRAAQENGQILEIGGTNTIDYERALTANADIAFVYSIGDRQTFKKFKEVGIPPVMLSDFMETSPLGRAEWMLFVSYFLGKEKEALVKFNEVAQQYEALKRDAALYSSQPTVLTGAVYNGTWYVAGGKSLMATFIKDAGARYLWADNPEVSGVPLDFEAIYAKALEVDYWINMSHFKDKKDLGDSEPKYQDFKAFQQGNMYNYYKRASDNGGSDIFESAIVQPNLVLQDMIRMFHHKDLKYKNLYYYIPLVD